MAEPLRILLVDDHILFRKGVASLIVSHQGMEVAGEAGDGLEAVAQARKVMPDVILMDISMPKCNGLEATRLIKREMPHVKIIMLTVSDDDRDLFAAIKDGAEGYLLKNLEPRQFFDMLEGIRQGEVAISGVMASKILHEFRQPEQSLAQPSEEGDELTSREIEVLELVVEGNTNKEIAESLSITENTVKIHLRNILEKLHLQNRIQAAVYAVRQGLVGHSQQAQ
ncbi:MAG: response regulator transcription factor [Anaerolineales bacterium]|nr:MAG: response regulator transcription factor [Anaerolineales bacterium]